MGRPFPLTTAQGGLNLLRTKGGARADNLVEMENAYVTQTGSIQPRHGVRRDVVFDPGTKGLMSFIDLLYVFASDVIPSPDPRYVVEILKHPTNPAAELVEIHFAAPFMGAPYVVAEWSDGSVYHYWLQSLGTWTSNTIYRFGDVVLPSVTTGYAYAATRLGDPNPLWTPNAARTVGDRVEPTVSDGFFYEVVDTIGASPRSGATEPDWNDQEGALTYEDVDLTPVPTAESGGEGGDATVPTDVRDRYRNQGGISSTRNPTQEL
jgi:hypothetical protein